MRRDDDHVLFPPRLWRTAFPRRLGALFHGGGLYEILSSRFAAVRVRLASRDWKFSTPYPLEWLLIEWPEGERSDENLAFDPARRHAPRRARRHGQIALAHRARLRGTQSELGLAHFEGRSWRGFHHHATLRIAAYGFLIRLNGRRFPHNPPCRPNIPAFPPVPDPETPPIRPERHIDNSIATIRRRLTVALARTLTRCPCCQASPRRPPYRGSS